MVSEESWWSSVFMGPEIPLKYSEPQPAKTVHIYTSREKWFRSYMNWHGMKGLDGQGLDRQIDSILYCMDLEFSRGDTIYVWFMCDSTPEAMQDPLEGAVLKTFPCIFKENWWIFKIGLKGWTLCMKDQLLMPGYRKKRTLWRNSTENCMNWLKTVTLMIVNTG